MADKSELHSVLGAFLIEKLRAEFVAQGHNLSGSLVESIESKVEATAGGFAVRFYANDYGAVLNTGVSAERIPYTPGGARRGGKSKYIQALIRYVQRRMNLRGKEATSAAFAIARKHAKEGMPTRDSYRHSTNGRRTGWIDAVLEANEAEAVQIIETWAAAQIEILITNFAKN